MPRLYLNDQLSSTCLQRQMNWPRTILSRNIVLMSRINGWKGRIGIKRTYWNLQSNQIKRLKLIRNSFSRAVIRAPKRHHITPVFKSLHCLKISERTHVKVISLTCNSLQCSQEKSLCELTIQPPRRPRSSSNLTLSRSHSLLTSCSPPIHIPHCS